MKTNYSEIFDRLGYLNERLGRYSYGSQIPIGSELLEARNMADKFTSLLAEQHPEHLDHDGIKMNLEELEGCIRKFDNIKSSSDKLEVQVWREAIVSRLTYLKEFGEELDEEK